MIVRELLTKIGFLFDQGAFNRSERGFLKLAGMAGALAGAVAGVTYGLWRSVEAATHAGEAAVDGANRLGITAEAYQKLGFVAQQSGASVGALEGALKFLQRTSYEASKGGKAQSKVFQALGLSAKDAAKQSSPELLGKIADKIAAIKNPTEQTAMATKLLGRSFGTALLPMLKEGSKGIDKLMERADALGFVLSNEDAAAAENFGDLLEQLGLAVKGVSLRLGSKLIPIAKKVVEAMIDWFIANKKLIDQGLDMLVKVVDYAVKGLFELVRIVKENKVFFIAFTTAALMPAIKGLALFGAAMLKNLAIAALSAAPFLALAAIIGLLTEEVIAFFSGDNLSLLQTFVDVFDKPHKAGETWWVSVLKDTAFYLREVNKEFKDAGGFFQAWANTKKGMAEDYDNSILGKIDDFAAGRVGPEQREKYRNGPIRMYHRDADGIARPRGSFADMASPPMRKPTNDELINMGMGPITVGDIHVSTTVAPGTSPTETAEHVKKGVMDAVEQASRQGGGAPRGVR